MADTTTFSTILDTDIKEAAVEYCKRKGLKLRHFVQQAIIEQLEDAIDLDAYHQRKNEDTVPLEDL